MLMYKINHTFIGMPYCHEKNLIGIKPILHLLSFECSFLSPDQGIHLVSGCHQRRVGKNF
jgi:hypothetical protein